MGIDALRISEEFLPKEIKDVEGKSVQSQFDISLGSEKLGTPDDNINQLITSKFGCTPGCGNTGTGNSFCCSC